MPAEEVPEGEGDEYPDGKVVTLWAIHVHCNTPGEEQSPEDTLGYAELTTDELKAAFRIFDDIGDGFISVEKFKVHNNKKRTHPDPSYVHVAMQKY